MIIDAGEGGDIILFLQQIQMYIHRTDGILERDLQKR